jgi:ABC-type microcin C transport system permease subunit YejB
MGFILKGQYYSFKLQLITNNKNFLRKVTDFFWCLVFLFMNLVLGGFIILTIMNFDINRLSYGADFRSDICG